MDGERFGIRTESPSGSFMPGQSAEQWVAAGVHSLEAFSSISILLKGPDSVTVSSNQNTNWQVC
jgi:hypothetical protein